MFKAEINPDIKFFGFNLTKQDAFGDEDPKLETDDWGWYFVIQQIPGEPRFGMDINFDPNQKTVTWDDLSWDKYSAPNGFINTTVKPHDFPLNDAVEFDKWGNNSAKMGDILFQKPVMIAIHAKEMLKNV